MNISIPADLKQRMDAIDEPANWSAIASDAFRIHLQKLVAKKININMKEIIERLRASQQTTENEILTAGEQAGRDWAARKAEAIQLRRLKEAWDPAKYLDPVTDPVTAFYYIIEPKFDRDHRAAEDFWEAVIGEVPEMAYANGFAAGAIDIWDKVEDHL